MSGYKGRPPPEAFVRAFLALILTFTAFHAQGAAPWSFRHAVQHAACHIELAPENPHSWLEMRGVLARALSDLDSAMAELEITSLESYTVTGLLGHGAGGLVYQLHTNRGRQALKAWAASHKPENYRPSILIHAVLAELGLAPALTGVLAAPGVGSLLTAEVQRAYPPEFLLGNESLVMNPGLGVIMGFAPGGESVKIRRGDSDWRKQGGNTAIPPFLARVRQALENLGIVPGDPQLLIDPNTGAPLLIDFDFYDVVVGPRVYGAFHPAAGAVISPGGYFTKAVARIVEDGRSRAASDPVRAGWPFTPLHIRDMPDPLDMDIWRPWIYK